MLDGEPRVGARLLAERTGLTTDAVEESLGALAGDHVLVLRPEADPGGSQVWMAPPFSVTPTPFVVRAGGRSWWANCGWDALAAATLVGPATVEAVCGDCGEPLAIEVGSDRPPREPFVLHLLVPARDFWKDIGFT